MPVALVCGYELVVWVRVKVGEVWAPEDLG